MLKIILITLGLGGLGISSYIFKKKRAKKVLVCPIGADCDSVVHSDFSKFFGIPLEIIGLFYYSLVVVAYISFLFLPELAHLSLMFALVAIGATALLFSAYLTFIQAFSLKQWCTWCLGSATISFFIFFLSLFSTDAGFLSLMEENYEAFVSFHFLGLSLGIGGAAISNILFLKFLKDCQISKFEADVMKTLSQVMWFALAVIILSGIGVYSPEAGDISSSSVFLAKFAAVLFIIIAGAILNLIISPKMVRKSLEGETAGIRVKVGYGFYGKISFALGAALMSSWIFILIIEIFKESFWSVSSLLFQGIYVAIVLASALVGLAYNKILTKDYKGLLDT